MRLQRVFMRATAVPSLSSTTKSPPCRSHRRVQRPRVSLTLRQGSATHPHRRRRGRLPLSIGGLSRHEDGSSGHGQLKSTEATTGNVTREGAGLSARPRSSVSRSSHGERVQVVSDRPRPQRGPDVASLARTGRPLASSRNKVSTESWDLQPATSAYTSY
jgi:hypothetical protein